MRISNSKKQLAKIIHENGGWRDGMSFSWYGNKTGKGYFAALQPRFDKASGSMTVYGVLGTDVVSFECEKVSNWHQTILSRDEYFHLYQAPVEVVIENKTTCHLTVADKPTIEQLAAEYRNAKDHAEAMLAELVAAGKALGLVLSVAEPESELVITDWRDLLVGDVVWYGGDDGLSPGEYHVMEIEAPDYEGYRTVLVNGDGGGHWIDTRAGWGFIRRPAKGDANA